MPTQTSTKAKRVPMLVSSTTSLMLAIAANTATTTPVSQVVTCGVRYFGWTFAAHCGSRPSRAIEKKMRGWPSWKTSSTEVVAITAPSEMMIVGHFMPQRREGGRPAARRCRAAARGACR